MNALATQRSPKYVGRFAPSPSGPLHLGSLIAAVSSYVDAKSKNGLWFLRIEDLDPPREPPGAAEYILDQLFTLSLRWDGDVLYQSTRLDAYQESLARLSDQGLSYNCNCTRSQIKAMGSAYDGSCRDKRISLAEEFAIRVKTSNNSIGFDDQIQGYHQQSVEREVGDFIILRKDKLFAYQLAVVIDDDYQQITHVIRGYDLLDSTFRQIHLQNVLGLNTPAYAHIPVIIDHNGKKLSKQHFADPIDAKNDKALIFKALKFLGQAPPIGLAEAPCSEQLEWAIDNWDIQAIPKLANISEKSKRIV
ncbi:MAG: tRNA glutamyl-Q(34) synthetase GluQRS [Gammaproteobacteria bacterium]|nr:tRNA glutamyl-Q(34) synthetase GluQRS [Gammaproteobacteria bacterium]